MSGQKKTAEELWQEVTERLERRSVTEFVDGKPVCKTFYYPMPDGSIRFSYWGELMRGNGVITGKEADELRAKHPEWFESDSDPGKQPEGPQAKQD